MATDEPDTGRPVSTRRDFLRNSAVAGGVVWAAPTILSLGPSAFATDGSERCYRFRYNASGDDPASYECSDNPQFQECDEIPNYTDYTCVGFSNNPPRAWIPEGDISVTENDDGSVTFTLPAGCVFQIVEAKAGGKAGTPDKPGTLDCSEDFTPNEDADGNTINGFTVGMGGSPDGVVRAVSHVDVVFCCG